MGSSTLACPTSTLAAPGIQLLPGGGTRSAPRGALGRALLLSIKWFLFAGSNLSGCLHVTGWARSANSEASGLAASCLRAACSRAATRDGIAWRLRRTVSPTGCAGPPGREERLKEGTCLSHLYLLSAAVGERGRFWGQLGTQVGAHSPVSQFTHHFSGAPHG